MTSVYPGPGPVAAEPAPLGDRIRYLEWSPVVAGAIAAAALALVLHAFALAIGLSVSSTAPTWRDASFALALLSGLYLVLAALAAYGLGGYLAGLMRARLTSREDADLRDGLHGLLVWGLATLLTAVIGLATVQSLPRLAVRRGRPPSAVRTSSLTTSTVYSEPNAGRTPTSSIPVRKRLASCSPPRATAAFKRMIAPISCG
jgi:hypothetical protein